MFETGDVVLIYEVCGGIVGAAQVVEHDRAEIELVNIWPDPGRKSEFAHFTGEGWKLLFPGLRGRCFSQRAPNYKFRLM